MSVRENLRYAISHRFQLFNHIGDDDAPLFTSERLPGQVIRFRRVRSTGLSSCLNNHLPVPDLIIVVNSGWETSPVHTWHATEWSPCARSSMPVIGSNPPC